MTTSVIEADDLEQSKGWLKALRAKYGGEGTFEKEDWDKLLRNCQAVSDFPSAAFFPELLKVYPDVKVVLNTRDIDTWHVYVHDVDRYTCSSVPTLSHLS
ncbi:hypothetical protein VTO42DRAFT_8333 [Malbranchea cinnamomea]